MNEPDYLIESWSTFYSYQLEAQKRYKRVWNIPYIKKLALVFPKIAREKTTILDVGANGNRLGEKISKYVPGIIYKSMDVDPVGDHDYHSLSEIKEKFDIVVFSEVIEHIPFKEGVKTLREIRELIKPGGYLVVSTPNMKHPHRYWGTPDHVTPYSYDCLAGLLMGLGFRIETLYRVHNQPFPQIYIRRWIGVWLHRYLDIDFALSIIAVARLPEQS
ncbi:MAG: class I SAM-dependent methyltransferase [Candidatus Omnitrophota bacterium]|jgi:SAM-dependent methyltransferase|nr:MAG: class I SAM-dependent methyltransferase [Candidatus Omnitrophota bacterium]